jgi:hypothetical protein
MWPNKSRLHGCWRDGAPEGSQLWQRGQALALLEMGETPAPTAGDGNNQHAIVTMEQNGGRRTWFLGSRIRWEVASGMATQSIDGGVVWGGDRDGGRGFGQIVACV